MFIFLTRSYTNKYYNHTISQFICGFILYLLLILMLFKISNYSFNIIIILLFIVLEIYFFCQEKIPILQNKPNDNLLEMEEIDDNYISDPSLDIEIFHDTTEDLSNLFYTDMEKN